jgi:uncharacterized membrane protein
MENRVMIVNNEEQALKQVQALHQEAYPLHQIYILSSDKEKSDELSIQSGTGHIFTGNEGLSSALKNLLYAQEERLLAEMEALGMTEQEALQYEQALEFGGFLIVAKPKQELYSYWRDEERASYGDRIPSLQQNW